VHYAKKEGGQMSFANEMIKRNNVSILGSGEKTLLLAHGFGCDQNMWRFMLPALTAQYRVVFFFYLG
jgi:sigma-B regulation protein RsbQ